tara:strand:+ start:140 stop:340 length:201 start_codon:yes stop_codon:yes gene_type:complete
MNKPLIDEIQTIFKELIKEIKLIQDTHIELYREIMNIKQDLYGLDHQYYDISEILQYFDPDLSDDD